MKTKVGFPINGNGVTDVDSDPTDYSSIDLGKRARVITAVIKERTRQEELKAAGKFPATCADISLNDAERLAILAEEFGEVSREVAEYVIHNKTDTTQLKAELTQVAAVCVAWLEYYEC